MNVLSNTTIKKTQMVDVFRQETLHISHKSTLFERETSKNAQKTAKYLQKIAKSSKFLCKGFLYKLMIQTLRALRRPHLDA